jgi:hypothetical protein
MTDSRRTSESSVIAFVGGREVYTGHCDGIGLFGDGDALVTAATLAATADGGSVTVEFEFGRIDWPALREVHTRTGNGFVITDAA